MTAIAPPATSSQPHLQSTQSCARPRVHTSLNRLTYFLIFAEKHLGDLNALFATCTIRGGIAYV